MEPSELVPQRRPRRKPRTDHTLGLTSRHAPHWATKGYSSKANRAAQDRGIAPTIPYKTKRNKPIFFTKTLYKARSYRTRVLGSSSGSNASICVAKRPHRISAPSRKLRRRTMLSQIRSNGLLRRGHTCLR
jgi:hypothetical protein